MSRLNGYKSITDRYCVIRRRMGQSEVVEWFDTKTCAQHFAKQWNKEAETDKNSVDDFYSVLSTKDWL